MTNFLKQTVSSHIANSKSALVKVISALALTALSSAQAFAASPVLSTEPLTSSSSAKPNLMFVLDNSFSMNKNYVTRAIDDDTPPLVRQEGVQCKAAVKYQDAKSFIEIKKEVNKLKLKVSGGDFSKLDRVYLAVPSHPQYSGVYVIKESNHADGTGGYCATPTYNTTVITRSPYPYGDTGGYWYGPPENRQYRQPCSNGPAISNIQNFTNHRYVSGSTSQCGWVDPMDSNIGTVVTGCSNYINGTPGVSGRVLEVDLDEYSGPDGVLTITDASITMAINFNAAGNAVGWGENSSCIKYNYGDYDDTYGWEPPQHSNETNNLYYNPRVSYTPPPWPNKFNVAAPGNLLPSMTSAYTTGWTKVPSDGLKLIGGNPIAPASAVTGNLTKSGEMVYCDTPYRPSLKVASNPASGAFASDKEWHESNRCVHNHLASNTVANSSNYPYQYPARVTGSTTNPIYFYDTAMPHQHGDSSLGSNSPIFKPMTALNEPMFAYGQYYYDAAPYYYNVRPIEHCTNEQLTDCVLGGKTATHPYPSYVRYCKSWDNAVNVQNNPAAGACQARYTGFDWSGNYFSYARYGLFEYVGIKTGGTYAKDPITLKTYLSRHEKDGSGNQIAGDCASDTGCTYNEEMTNFANWYAYYRTRMQMMKSSSAHAFNPLDDKIRVGLMTINEAVADDPADADSDVAGTYLKINDFTGSTNLSTGHKQTWLERLYNVNSTLKTPLREALSKVGRVYAGKATDVGLPVGDPVQLSCQQNFTLLTTDGYWNGPTGKRLDNTTDVGNQDGGTTPRPQKEGAGVSNSLADVAYYYYKTDLRDSALSNCTAESGSDVCLNDVKATASDSNPQQHMTTYTLGLGVIGDLAYTPDYKTATSGDFFDLKNGSKNWPYPNQNQPTAVDDLWHAAVNGYGTYYSAQNKEQLSKGIEALLTDITSVKGSNSAIALNDASPDVGGDAEYAYIAQYINHGTGQGWSGNLYARELIATGSGASITASLSPNVTWCVESLDAVTGLNPVNACTPNATTGLTAKVAANTDTRTIYTNVGGSLTSFEYGNLNATQKAYFDASYLSTRLSQWASYSPEQITKINSAAVEGVSLVNYLRGQYGFDDRSTNDLSAPLVPNDNRLYRMRNKVLGDIVESDPEYVGKTVFNYVDAGYAAYAATTVSRDKTVYIGANDGMLHAFNADTGEERWAFVPTAVMPNLWRLADKNYQHANYINGEMTIADIQVGGVWKTILVSGFGQGGRGYFALDITNPSTPQLLWEVDSLTPSFNDLGYSFGKPVVTKKADGTWVVLLTSGYNNTSPGDGKGHLFVVNANSGALLTNISTGVGDTTTPSGLAQVSLYAISPNTNNQALKVYGGDLLGNLWRFDINTSTVSKLTNLVSASNDAQPVTSAPAVARIKGKPVLFLGTGKYLESADRLAVNYKPQTMYAIKDSGATIANLRTTLVAQTLSATGTTTKTATSNAVDWGLKNGWYIDFIDAGERQILKPKLAVGILTVATVIPPTGTCDINGRGWKYILDYKTGSPLVAGGNVGELQTSPIVGLTLIQLGDKAGNTTGDMLSDGKIPNPTPPLSPYGILDFLGDHGAWRELIDY